MMWQHTQAAHLYNVIYLLPLSWAQLLFGVAPSEHLLKMNSLPLETFIKTLSLCQIW